MESLFIYFGKVILTSAVMFAYYHFALRNRTFHHYNRFYLLASVFLSLFLPFLKVSDFTISVNPKIFLLLSKIQNFQQINPQNHGDLYFRLAALAAGAVSAVFLIRFLFGILKINRLKHGFKKEKFQDISFYQTNLEAAPFSFFRNLFWKNSIEINSEVGRQILKHEMVHIEQKHSIDKVLMEVAVSIFWFNPVFWFIKKEINLIHEYLADKKAVKNMDTRAFAQMLLAGHFSGKVIPGTSPFLSSNLKKRLNMLKKPNSKAGYLRRILALPVVFAVAFVWMVNAKNRDIRETNLMIEKNLQKVKIDTTRPKTSPEIPVTGTANSEKNNLTKPEKADEVTVAEETAKISEKDAKEAGKEASIEAKNAAKAVKESEKAKLESSFKTFENQLKANESSAQNPLDFNQDLKNSPVFKNLIEDSKRSSAKLQEYFDSDAYKKAIEESKKSSAKIKEYFNSDAYKKAIEDSKKSSAKLQRYFNSDAYKKAMENSKKSSAKLKEFFNSDDYKKILEDSKKSSAKLQEYFNSDAFKKAMEDSKKKFLEEADKDIGFHSYSLGKTTLITSDKNSPEIFIDGFRASEGQLKALSPDKIESVTIYKNKDKTSGEIRVTTKK